MSLALKMIIRQNLQKVLTKIYLIFILTIISGCTHKRESCFKAFGGSILWNKYLTIKFDNRFKQIIHPSCIKDGDLSLFSIGFGISDKEIKRDEGNTALIHFTLIPFTQKQDSQEIDDMINYLAKKYLSEAKDMGKDNSRFSYIYSKTGPITKDKDKICKIVVASIKDNEAENIPLGEKYLLQNDIFKTCFLKKYNQIITFATSYRITPGLEKNFWLNNAVENLNLASLNIIMNDGKSLAQITKNTQQEIIDLK